jgi:hypothetical protein
MTGDAIIFYLIQGSFLMVADTTNASSFTNHCVQAVKHYSELSQRRTTQYIAINRGGGGGETTSTR